MENKKVKNATVCQTDGINFRSKQEASVYKYLLSQGITPQYEPEKFTIWDRGPMTVPFYDRYGKTFKRLTRKPTAIHYTPDFIFTVNGITVFLEVKGFSNDVFPYKAKLFRDYLENQPNKENLCYAIIYAIKDLKLLLDELHTATRENEGVDTNSTTEGCPAGIEIPGTEELSGDTGVS